MEAKSHLIKSFGAPPAPLVAEEISGAWHDTPPSGHHGEGQVRYGAVLRRYQRAITAIIIACLLLGGLVTFFMTPSYKAKAVVEVLAVNPEFLNNKDVDPNTSGSTMDTYLETQTKLLLSDGVADRVVTVLSGKGAEYKHERGDGWAKLRRWVGLQPPVSDEGSAEIRNSLAHMKVKAEGQSSLISITVMGPTPQLAADTANAVADQHIAALQDSRWQTANDTAEFLTAQLDTQRKKLQTSDEELQEYARKTGLIYISGADRDSIATEKLRAIQADLSKAESDRADKQAQLELINGSPADSLPKVLDSDALREDKSRLTELRRQLADLSATLTPNHYKVKEMQAQIAAVEKQAVQERNIVVARVQNDFRAAQRRQQILQHAYEQQLGLVSDQSGKAVRYKMLQREVEANRDLYQSTLQKIREASVLSALRSSNVRVVDRAKAPLLPYQPSLPINVAIAALTGCMLSVLFVLMRERSDRSIRTPGESARLLQVPELAIIPSARRDIRTQIVSSANWRNPKRPLLASADGSGSTDLVTGWQRSGSLVAESFRSAVTSIVLWGRDRATRNKVLLVTSAHPGAGKTTSVLNLGLGLAESGRRVLLIDGDLRLPRLGEVFGLEQAIGLGDVLAEGMAPGIAQELIRDTGLPNLFVLPSGSRQPNVTQLLHLTSLGILLDSVKYDYDFILIDSPPALTLSDARLMARHADGVILVFRAGETSVEQSVAVRKYFWQDGTHVFGSILNDWNAQAEDPAYVNSYTQYAVRRPPANT